MEDQQIIQEIDKLNLKMGETNSAINNVSRSLDNFSDTFQQLVSRLLTPDNLVDKYSPALFGLFGVLLGALIAYYFNRRIYKEQLIGRFAIQRKNLIFSKLYKESVNIKKSLNSIPKNCFYFELNIDIDYPREKYFYFGENAYAMSEFILWNEMKNDIRKTQIPGRIKKEMYNLEKAIIKYLDSLRKFNKRCIEMKEKEKSNKIIIFEWKYDKIYYKDYSVEKIIAINIKKHGHGHQDNIKVQNEIENIVKRVIDRELLNVVEKDFENMKIALDKTNDILYKTIQEIVNKYEYGKLL